MSDGRWKIVGLAGLPELDEAALLATEEEHTVQDRDGRNLTFTGVQIIILRLLDGSRTAAEVATILSELVEADVEVDEITRFATTLARAGCLEGLRPMSFGARLTQLAREQPTATALILCDREGVATEVSWQVLEERSNQVAHLFLARGVGPGSTVVVAVPNGLSHFCASFAAWKVGAMVLPLRANLPGRERQELLALVERAIVVGNWDEQGDAFVGAEAFDATRRLPVSPPPDRLSAPGKAIASGGSTGRPKIIVDPEPWARFPGESDDADSGFEPGQVQLVAGPLYHNAPFTFAYFGLFEAHTLVVLEKFDAALAADLIERHRVGFAMMAPTAMQRIARLEDIGQRDFSSVRGILHTGAPCPPWVKRAWIDLVGAEHVFEGYGAAEGVGGTAIRGDEWLAHPGSVGKPQGCELRILDDELREVPTGEVGEVYTRWPDRRETFAYVGAAAAKTTPDGFVSVGDLGWVDSDGYLYIADRRVDLILSGGANVYPAEVEAALTEHASVADVAVVGLPDDEWGKRVHAIVQRREGHELTDAMLDAHCRERLASYKCPKTYEWVASLPRDDAGKIRRRALLDDRVGKVG